MCEVAKMPKVFLKKQVKGETIKVKGLNNKNHGYDLCVNLS
jgi:hypothetical protein